MLQGCAFSEIKEVMRSNSYAGFPIVTQTNRLVGYITREDLEDGINQAQRLYAEQAQVRKRLFIAPSDNTFFIARTLPSPLAYKRLC